MGKQLSKVDPKNDSLYQNPGVGVPKQHPDNGVRQDKGEKARAAIVRQEKSKGPGNQK
jgi:hypothetical protein